LNAVARFVPPFCPNERCAYHRTCEPDWRWQRAGFFSRQAVPHRIQRFRCCYCRRYFSTQTFRTDYWLKRPDLLLEIFHRLVACSGFRQIARRYDISPQTVLTHSARLGRHCLLFHEEQRPRGPLREAIALDGFESFEFSQFHPTRFHVVVGKLTHFFYGFTCSELRRSGRMTAAQKRKRLRLELELGTPDPRQSMDDVTRILRLVTRDSTSIELHTDAHRDYPRAIRRLRDLRAEHRTISSRASRTPQNPLWPVNHLDLLIRHSGADHKRKTIAQAKRRQSSIERLFVFLVWLNYAKWFSEQRRDVTPAMSLGLASRRLRLEQILEWRRFPHRVNLPSCWAPYYWRKIQSRELRRNREHRLRYAC
jgi:transposase-like protein